MGAIAGAVLGAGIDAITGDDSLIDIISPDIPNIPNIVIPEPAPAPEPPKIEVPDMTPFLTQQQSAMDHMAESQAKLAEQQADLLAAEQALADRQLAALEEENANAASELAAEEEEKKRRLRLAASGPMTLLTGGRGDTSTPSLLKPKLSAG